MDKKAKNKFFKQIKIKPDEPILLVTAEEALENILEVCEQFGISFDRFPKNKKFFQKLFETYANNLLLYHPDDFHPERKTLLDFADELKLTDEEFKALDFS
ncbi:MAG: hypothetical protein QXI58_00660 [Candidatus Micrarchaeia archaeon]